MSWYNPGSWDWGAAKDWMFGGSAGNNIPTKTQTGQQQRDYATGMLNRTAPQMNTAQSDQTRGQQQNLAGMLGMVASGQQVGAGEMAVNRQVGQAQAAQAAQANMARGANAGMANRNAARTSADVGVTGAGQAAQAQLQDATNAQAQLNQLLGTQRAQDIGVANANLGANMGQQNIQLGALAQMLGVDQAELAAQIAKANANAADKGMFGSLLQTGGQIGASYASGGMKG